MAKYLAQIILVGAQVVGRAFMRALRQEFAASRAAADARGRSERPQSAAASRITGISLQEAQQILNVSNLNPEEIQKVMRQGQGGTVLAGGATRVGVTTGPRRSAGAVLGPVNPFEVLLPQMEEPAGGLQSLAASQAQALPLPGSAAWGRGRGLPGGA
uniref:Presequence translocase associated motor 16 n=1 Tax=Calidris pygmaea TaxID=425635 RepID=A0A8C3K0D3_9CHAR